MSTSVVVALTKSRSKEQNCAATNFDLTINFDFFDLLTLESVMYQRQTWFVNVS